MLLAGALRERRVATLAVDPAMAFLFVDRLRKAAPSVELIDGSSVLDRCRMLTSPDELALIAPAQAMTLELQNRATPIPHEGIAASDVRRRLHHAPRHPGASR